VVALESTRHFDVQLGSGERYAGAISAANGRLEVKTSDGPRSTNIKNVVRISLVAATFVERTTGSVDLGFSYLQANDEVDLDLDATAENRTRNYWTDATVASTVRHRSGANVQTRNKFLVETKRLLPSRWFALGQFKLQEDQFLDLDARVLIDAAIGQYLIQSNVALLGLHAGLDYDAEKYGDLEGTNHFVEALAGLEWDLFDPGSNTDLLTKATTYLTLNQSRFRLELDSDLHHTLYRNFYWSMGLFEDYNSDPPPGRRRSDFGLTVGIGRSF
jgi:hypothetical protein